MSMLRTHLFSFSLFVVLVAALTSCGKEVVPAPSFSLRVRTVPPTSSAPTVLLQAVDQLEVVLKPQSRARFIELPCSGAFADCGGIQCCKYDGGQLSTFISPEGWYVIRAEESWVRSHAQAIDTGFSVVVPIYATSTADSPGSLDPVAMGTFLRLGERIAVGSITLGWPLHGTGQDLPIMCWPGFEPQCEDIDPTLPIDGGP
jgi:hypothetical protein